MRRKLTLFDVFLIVAFIGVLSASFVSCSTLVKWKDPVVEATDWTLKHGVQSPLISCVEGLDADSDHNGYISCTVSDQNDKQMYLIECSYGYFRGGCRLVPRAKL